jgi:hypothetical protein
VAPTVVACPLATSELLFVDEIGLPLAGLAVTLRFASGAVISTTTDVDGKVGLNVAPGTTGEAELVQMHEGASGDSTSTPSGRHFAAGGTGP